MVQWLASRTTGQGVPGSRPGRVAEGVPGSRPERVAVRCGKSHLPPAKCWLNPGSRGRTTDLDRL